MPAELLPAPAPSACGQPGLTSSLSRRLPSLDGWRALSILLVLGSHCIYATGFPREFRGAVQRLFDGNPGDGNLGVRFFFTISGFLITWLLLQEWTLTRTFSLRHFYLRRCLRILPVYCVFLLVLVLLQGFSQNYQNGQSWAACLTFTRNTFGNNDISAHLWSLSVEEQFYLLWPSVLLLLLARRKLTVFVVATGFVILLGPVFRGGMETFILPNYPAPNVPQEPAARFVFFAAVMAGRFFIFADALAFGCLAAILLNFKPAGVRAILADKPAGIGLAAVACVLGPQIIRNLTETPPIILLEFGNTLQAFGFTILLLQSVLLPRATAYRVLNWGWIRELGVLSYSIYIWQQLFWTAPGQSALMANWWKGIWLLPLLFTAAASYYLLERPLVRMRARFRPKSPR